MNLKNMLKERGQTNKISYLDAIYQILEQAKLIYTDKKQISGAWN